MNLCGTCEGGSSHYSASLKPADAQRICYFLTVKPLQKVKREVKKGF